MSECLNCTVINNDRLRAHARARDFEIMLIRIVRQIENEKFFTLPDALLKKAKLARSLVERTGTGSPLRGKVSR